MKTNIVRGTARSAVIRSLAGMTLWLMLPTLGALCTAPGTVVLVGMGSTGACLADAGTGATTPSVERG